MRYLASILPALLSIFVFFPLAVQARISFDFSASTKSSSNLLQDSSTTYDAFSITSATVEYIPLPSLKVSISGRQTYYRETIGLSNIFGRINVTYIPLSEKSRFSLYLNANINGRKYHNDFSGVDNNFGGAVLIAGYQLNPRLYIRGGISYRSTVYINTDSDYKRDLDFILGLNAILPGQTSFDFEAGFGRTNYSFKDANLTGDGWPLSRPDLPEPIPYDDMWIKDIPDTKDNLWLLYFSPRLSRSLGKKNGVSITYTAQNFQNYRGGFLWDISTGYLSPWATVWEGQSVLVNIKSFAIRRLIINTGYGYWNKQFLTTSNRYNEQGDDRTYWEVRTEDKHREDIVNRFFFSVQLPVKLNHEYLIEPVFNIEHSNNNSNKLLYDFNDYSITTGVSLRFK
ncbi:MAG: hypothetical protein V3V99_10925 [candidate division Zixibacteria bacterium]